MSSFLIIQHGVYALAFLITLSYSLCFNYTHSPRFFCVCCSSLERWSISKSKQTKVRCIQKVIMKQCVLQDVVMMGNKMMDSLEIIRKV